MNSNIKKNESDDDCLKKIKKRKRLPQVVFQFIA